ALNQWEEQRQTLLDYQTELKDQIEAVGDRVRDLSVNRDEVARLKGQLKSLEKISEQQQSEIARQEHELKKTKRKNQELHAMIVQSGQESEPFDDTYIRASFDRLMADIEHLVNKYFPAGQGITGWKEYDKIKESADRDFFRRAHIASTFCQELLSHNARVFGLHNDSEEDLGVFEKMLHDSSVPVNEVISWRVQTTNVVRQMKKRMITRDYRTRVEKLSDTLLTQHKPLHLYRSAEDWRSAKADIRTLCDFAFDLAFSIRCCKTMYEWHQEVPASSINRADVEEFGPPAEPVQVLFGPVYKRVDQTRVLLRKGLMLHSSSVPA
ncbi:MAG: hypothetical protein L6R42_008744, partial [Xanthoria sp. 1 TBL-2021]